MEPTAVWESRVAKQQCGKYSDGGECRTLARGGGKRRLGSTGQAPARAGA